MIELYKNIKNLREEKGLSQEDLAKMTGYTSRSSIAKIEKGEVDLQRSKIIAFANALGVQPGDLMGWNIDDSSTPKPNNESFDNIFPVSVKKFPLLGEISCGEPIFANEDRESYVLAGTDIDADFCVQARGDSMIGARILDGDIVFIKETNIVNNGEIAAIAIDDEVLLKRIYYFPNENLLTLQSENPKYAPKNYSGEQLDHVRIMGRAVCFQSDVI